MPDRCELRLIELDLKENDHHRAQVEALWISLYEDQGKWDPNFAFANPKGRAVLRPMIAQQSVAFGLLNPREMGHSQPPLRGFVAATMEGSVDGLAVNRWVELNALYVHPGARGQGCGGVLANRVTQWAYEKGYDHVRLYVLPGNPAVQLYERMGYETAQLVMNLDIRGKRGMP